MLGDAMVAPLEHQTRKKPLPPKPADQNPRGAPARERCVRKQKPPYCWVSQRIWRGHSVARVDVARKRSDLESGARGIGSVRPFICRLLA